MWIPSRVTCAAAVLEILLEIPGKTVHVTACAAPRPIPPVSPVCPLLSPNFPLLPPPSLFPPPFSQFFLWPVMYRRGNQMTHENDAKRKQQQPRPPCQLPLAQQHRSTSNS